MAPEDSEHKDLEVIDFTRNLPITEAVEKMKELFGKDVDIYAVGFSLGANHIKRHLGAHEDCKEICGIKAFLSVSSAYDLPGTVATIKYSVAGVYDQYILGMLV